MWPARHWRNLASQMLDIDGEDLWGPSPGPLLRVQCHLRRRPSDIRSPMRDPHRLSAKSWSPRRAWASRARRAHGGTAKGSAKQLGCPRRDSGVTDGAVLLTSSRPLSRKTSTDRQTCDLEATGEGDWGSQTRRQPAPASVRLLGWQADHT